jgi:HemK-like putative methylase
MRIATLPGVFRPRPDTWMLAAQLRAQLRPGATVLDVCTGSGALAICAALRGAREVTAVDVSRRAVWTARLNARLNRVRVRAVRSDLFSALGGARFDVIVSNPPYIATAVIATLSAEVRREPPLALDGRADGLQRGEHAVPLVGHAGRVGRHEPERRAARHRLAQAHPAHDPVGLGRRRDLPHHLLAPGLRGERSRL